MPMESDVRIGLRLKAARERSGLTQQQLANALGVRHRQTVASIEAGDRRLSAPELILSMQVLGVDLDYFTDPFRLVGEGQFSFRTSTGVEERVLDQFERRAGRWIAMYRELSREQGHAPRWLGYKLNMSAHSTFEDAQAAGEAAADLWELGCRPADHLRSVMEDRLHILVLYVDTPSGISGAACRVPGLNCALVNRGESEGRRNFDLAHELFHLLTWDALPPERTATVDASRRGKRWRVEKLADNFAGALLMPAEKLRRTWEATSAVGDVHERLNAVGGEMGVSAPACKWRLRNIGLLSRTEVKAVDDGLLGAHRRPACRTLTIPPFSGQFLGQVGLALDAGRLSVQRAAKLLGVSMTGLVQILRADGPKTLWHLYEVVISNSQVWLKMQASCSSSHQSAALFEHRFTGADRTVALPWPVTPFRLSQCSHFVANWASIVEHLPVGWDDDDFHIVGTPYPWCETLSDDCDCHGAKGRLDEVLCSDFGSHDETDNRASRSENVRHQHYIRTMEERITRLDEARRQERPQREQSSPPRDARVPAKPAGHWVDLTGVPGLLGDEISVVNRLASRGFFCSIEGRHHPYGEKAIQKTVASLASACAQVSTLDGAGRKLVISQLGDITAHWLQRHQSEDCARRSLWSDVDIPDILYKYIPKKLIGEGAPDSLRATQLLALNVQRQSR